MTLVRRRLVTAPSPPITLPEAKANLRVDHSEEDTFITRLILAASARAEKEAGRAFGPQTWEIILDAFPASGIEIPLGPLVSVTFIGYVTADGASATVPPDVYEAEQGHLDGLIRPLTTWPDTKPTSNAVTVRYVAGDGWPEEVKQAVHLIVGHWYRNRETAGERQEEIPFGASTLIGMHRRMFA